MADGGDTGWVTGGTVTFGTVVRGTAVVVVDVEDVVVV